MADNINIVYKVDTNELIKAQATLRATDQANEKLKQSTAEVGRAGVKEFGAMSNTIDGMKLRMQQLQGVINTTSPKNVEKLRQWGAEYRRLDAEVRRLTADIYKQAEAQKAVTTSGQNMSSMFTGLGQAVAVFLSYKVAQELVEMAVAGAELAGRIDGVRRAFQTQIPNSIVLLDELKEKTHGTVDELQLMQYAIRAQNFKIPLNDLGNLLEFATIRAQQTGESIDYMVNSIITGLGRDSIKILDNLQVDIGQMKKDMDTLGISIDEAFGLQVQREIQKMGGYVDNAGTSVKKLATEWSELKIVFAEVTSGVSKWVVDFFTESAQGAQYFFKILRDEKGKTFGDKFDNVARNELGDEKALDMMKVFNDTKLTENIKASREETEKLIAAEIELANQMRARNTAESEQWQTLIKLRTDLRKEVEGSGDRFQLEVKKIRDAEKVSAKEAREILDERIDQAIKAVDYYDIQNRALYQYTTLLRDAGFAAGKNKEVEEDLVGIINKLQASIDGLEDSLKTSTSERDIAKINVQLKTLNAELERLKKLGTGPVISPEALKNMQEAFSKMGLDDSLFEVKTDTKSINKYLDNAMMTASLGWIDNIKRQLSSLNDQLGAARTAEDIIRITNEVKRLQGELENLTSNKKKFSIRNIFEDPEAMEAFAVTGVDIWRDQLNSIAWAEVENYQVRLNNLKNFYDEQILLAGDNERAKDILRIEQHRKEKEIRKAMAQEEKSARRFSVVIDTAAGIMKAFATSSTIYEGLINAAIVAFQGASQLAIISRTAPQGFAKGVIDLKGGQAGKDSIPSMLMPGESVITTEATKGSKKLLKKVQAKEINDKVLDDLLAGTGVIAAKGQSFDDSGIIAAIHANAVDFELQGSTLWKAKKLSETRKVLTKSRVI
jgi:hypothetical protein